MIVVGELKIDSEYCNMQPFDLEIIWQLQDSPLRYESNSYTTRVERARLPAKSPHALVLFLCDPHHLQIILHCQHITLDARRSVASATW